MRLDYGWITQSHINAGRNLDAAASLRVMLIMRTRKMQLERKSVPEWILNNKIKAYEFIDSLGYRRPRLIHAHAQLDAITPCDQVVIKPYNGYSSRGVYLVFKRVNIFKIKSEKTIHDWSLLLENMREDIGAGLVQGDRWIVEELVVEDKDDYKPACDLKFYCFYGHAAMALEIVRFPQTRYCCWDRDKKRIDTGAYAEKSFDGKGFTDHMLEVAEAISRQIPSPFLRIDFHSTGSELVFCEFTPRPGGAWRYNKEIDQLMGDAYLAAEGRLLNDFLSGKKFEAFCRLQ